jgi:hypothetical protein
MKDCVEAGISDLAGRVNLYRSDIVVVAFHEVTWPNSASGCPARLTGATLTLRSRDRYEPPPALVRKSILATSGVILGLSLVLARERHRQGKIS